MLTKEVEVELTNNIKYYEDLGYNIPRYLNDRNQLKVKNGTTLVVNIDELLDDNYKYCNILKAVS